MPEKIRKPQHDRKNAPAPGSAEEYNANHLSASAGHPLHLPDGLRARLEARTGVDLGNVQMRESDQPESIGARAFTRGNVIDFAPGEFQPGTEEGEALIGHEVSHVIQQASGQVHADSGASPVNSDPALERAADAGAQGGGMESVPTMSYSASPVQGFFFMNHYRRWKEKKAAERQAAHIKAIGKDFQNREGMARNMLLASMVSRTEPSVQAKMLRSGMDISRVPKGPNKDVDQGLEIKRALMKRLEADEDRRRRMMGG